jgi:hypothetical protein
MAPVAWLLSPAPRHVRVSFAAILRIRDDEGVVLFEARSRPGAFTPPGGVFKHYGPAMDVLDRLGFRGDRWADRESDMRNDLRGLLPARSVPGFQRWFDSGAYREDADECLRRELAEELTEVGFPDLAADVRHLSFTHLRTEVEGPWDVPGKPYRQLRRLEFHDLVCTGQRAVRLRDRIIALAKDPRVHTVVVATPEDVAHGRAGRALIAPHAAYLTGGARTRSDIPSLR